MLETVWIKHVSLIDFKNNTTYHLDMTLAVTENVIHCMAKGELRKLVMNQDGKSPMIVTYSLDTALVSIGDVFFFMPKEEGEKLEEYYEKYCEKQELILTVYYSNNGKFKVNRA